MVELQIVILAVAGSSPVGHPTSLNPSRTGLRALLGSPGYLGVLSTHVLKGSTFDNRQYQVR